ncbi:hypothetical protein LV036_003433 [Salmonella enterica]|nr:hypothetical protein [Salmonella enterica]
MTTITKERLLKIQHWRETYGAGSNVILPAEEAEELARIALASLEAEPVAYNQVQRDMMKDIIVRKMGGNLAGEKLVMDDIHAVTMALIDAGFRTAPPASVVPEEMPKGLAGQIVSLLAHNIGDKFLAQKIWNACRAAMLQGEFRDLSQPVDPQISEYEKIMLQAGNSPVIPDGYALVPVEPTDEMIAAAMNCEDVLFNSDESFCVQFGNIYEAMLAAAPQQEVK